MFAVLILLRINLKKTVLVFYNYFIVAVWMVTNVDHRFSRMRKFLCCDFIHM